MEKSVTELYCNTSARYAAPSSPISLLLRLNEVSVYETHMQINM